MIYSFSMLLALVALVVGFPAITKLLWMHSINQNCKSASGEVISTPSAVGWMLTFAIGSSTRPQIRYFPEVGDEIVLQVNDGSMFTFRAYERGQGVEVVYDAKSPVRAYARPEWESMLKELALATGALVLAVILWVAGNAIGATW